MNKKLIIIYGPTGSGKTDCALSLPASFTREIINADVGQLYKPLSVGTAKPDWHSESIPHHLFDIVTTPSDYTVIEYKKAVLKKIDAIHTRGATPFLVGGSGFYILSLFFTPQHHCVKQQQQPQIYESTLTNQALWELLNKQDPVRAHAIHYNDRYRVVRALQLCAQNYDPSCMQPDYYPLPYDVLLVFLHPERTQLYATINARTHNMFEQGWISETKALLDTSWESFLKKKKLIGYNDIIDYLRSGDCSEYKEQQLKMCIQKKTRNYAKRQITFWRMMQKKLHPYFSNLLHAVECHSIQDAHKNITTFLKGDK